MQYFLKIKFGLVMKQQVIFYSVGLSLFQYILDVDEERER